MKKSAIVLWVLAALFLLGSFSFISTGEYSNLLGGLVLSALLGFLGYRQYKKTAPTSKKTEAAGANSPYEHKTFQVVGVTYDNEDGTSRQKILQRIDKGEPPFDGDRVAALNGYDFEGEQAYSVLVNDIQIGNISRKDIPFVEENVGRLVCITNVGVYRDDEDKSYGASVTIRFNK